MSKVEGLILYKMPYKERDLLIWLLLRDGRKISIICYGGRSGGKRYRSSILELGHLLAFELKQKRITSLGEDELFESREWSLQWYPHFIRDNRKAYYLMCFYLDVTAKVASHDEGVFRVLSNALFYLDESLEKKQFSVVGQCGIFLVKLLHGLGVFPRLENCIFCGQDFKTSNLPHFLLQEGAFACGRCHQSSMSGQAVYDWLVATSKTQYKNYSHLKEPEILVVRNLLNYFSFQFHLSEKEFKTVKELLALN